MNINLDNPYKDVTIPRAKLRASTDDPSMVIANPLALEDGQYASQANRNSALNPYGNFKPPGEDSQDPSFQNPSLYQNQQGGYTVKEEDEEVGRCYTCCRRCRKKK